MYNMPPFVSGWDLPEQAVLTLVLSPMCQALFWVPRTWQ